MIGENDTYEGKKERDKLERLSPIVVLDMVKKRFDTMQTQTQEAIEKLKTENPAAEKPAGGPEVAVDVQMTELTVRNNELQGRLQQMRDRVDALLKSIEDEHKLRLEAAVHSKAVVEAIKDDKKKLVKIIQDKEKEISVIKNIRGDKERLKKEMETLEVQKEQIRQEIKTMEKSNGEEIQKMEEEYAKGFDELGKKLELKRLMERKSEQAKREQEMDNIERQMQREVETDKQMAKRLSEVQSKLSRHKQKQRELEEKEKLESRENARLHKELELQKKRNNEYDLCTTSG